MCKQMNQGNTDCITNTNVQHQFPDTKCKGRTCSVVTDDNPSFNIDSLHIKRVANRSPYAYNDNHVLLNHMMSCKTLLWRDAKMQAFPTNAGIYKKGDSTVYYCLAWLKELFLMV